MLHGLVTSDLCTKASAVVGKKNAVQACVEEWRDKYVCGAKRAKLSTVRCQPTI